MQLYKKETEESCNVHEIKITELVIVKWKLICKSIVEKYKILKQIEQETLYGEFIKTLEHHKAKLPQLD